MYDKAISLEPENPNALAFSALNKTHLKQINLAKEQIDKVLKRTSDSAFLLYIAGRIYHLSGDYERAKVYLVKAYEMEQIPDVQNLLGLCYFELGNYEQAKNIFENMLKKVPMNVNVLLNAAKCCEKLNDTNKALDYAEQIVKTFPECEEAHELIRNLS
jgi:general transcription factor 3C polypeptide 3 (transcription factor C subunit 4)